MLYYLTITLNFNQSLQQKSLNIHGLKEKSFIIPTPFYFYEMFSVDFFSCFYLAGYLFLSLSPSPYQIQTPPPPIYQYINAISKHFSDRSNKIYYVFHLTNSAVYHIIQLLMNCIISVKLLVWVLFFKWIFSCDSGFLQFSPNRCSRRPEYKIKIY